MHVGRLILRFAIGGYFIGHGLQKLLGWWGGEGLEGTGQFFSAVGLAPGKRNAAVAGTAETVGGGLLAAGLATQLATSALMSVLTRRRRFVHRDRAWQAQCRERE